MMTTLMNYQCYQCVLDWGNSVLGNDCVYRKNNFQETVVTDHAESIVRK